MTLEDRTEELIDGVLVRIPNAPLPRPTTGDNMNDTDAVTRADLKADPFGYTDAEWNEATINDLTRDNTLLRERLETVGVCVCDHDSQRHTPSGDRCLDCTAEGDECDYYQTDPTGVGGQR